MNPTTSLPTCSGLIGADVVRLGDPRSGGHRHGAAEHAYIFGRLPVAIDPEWLDQQVRIVALTGRGGAHFPVATKWAAARRAAVQDWTVVVNGAEGEPASRKDAALLQLRPHLVLDGAEIAAAMVGAQRIVIWLADRAVDSVESVRQAIAERTPGTGPRIDIVTTAERYLSGESSSIIHAIQGGPALPRTTFDPGRSWAPGAPVLVHNAETVARLGVLARTGAAAYSPSSLVTVAEGDRRAVVEAPADQTFADLFIRAEVAAPQAVLLGGYGGEWVGWAELQGLHVDPHKLRNAGRSLGAGVLLTLPAAGCGLRATAQIADWLAEQSAGQCGPCRFGLPAVADLAIRLAGRPGRRVLEQLEGALGLVDGRGACRLPDGAVRMIRSALETFADEVLLHRGGQCSADAIKAEPMRGQR